MPESVSTVIDLGGTTLRTARYDADRDTVTDVWRIPTEGMARHPGVPAPLLRDRVVEQLVEQAGEALGRHRSSALGLAFAGPVTADGRLWAAPTIWGTRTDPLPLRLLLEQRLGVPTVVVNDLTAAVWRYVGSRPGEFPDDEPFSLITVSSGIGSKVFRAGEVLLDAEGHGGELGHWTCDPSPDAPLCDCGGRGHLGAVASGRAMEAAARRAAVAAPAGFARSLLAVPAGGRPDGIDNRALVAAIRDGDAFATAVLRSGLAYLASAITATFTAIGVRRYIIIGGFALAIGERYAELLTEEIARLGCFGLSDGQIRRMVVLGEPDDDHGLIGIGRLLASRAVVRQPIAVL